MSELDIVMGSSRSVVLIRTCRRGLCWLPYFDALAFHGLLGIVYRLFLIDFTVHDAQ